MYFYTTLSIHLLLFNLHTTRAQATLCTASNAISFESLFDTSDGSSSGGSSDTNFDSGFIDPDLVNIVNDSLHNSGESVKNAIGKKLKKRERVTCTASETCMSLGNEPLCVDVLSGDYHAAGERGNLETGDFTLDGGQTGNLYEVTGPTPSPSLGGATSTSSSAAIRISTSVTGGGAGTKYNPRGLVLGAMTFVLGMLLI